MERFWSNRIDKPAFWPCILVCDFVICAVYFALFSIPLFIYFDSVWWALFYAFGRFEAILSMTSVFTITRIKGVPMYHSKMYGVPVCFLFFWGAMLVIGLFPISIEVFAKCSWWLVAATITAELIFLLSRGQLITISNAMMKRLNESNLPEPSPDVDSMISVSDASSQREDHDFSF